MSYLARIEGVYRHRTRINLLLFSIVGPWKTDTFTFERAVPELAGDWTWQPAASVPLSVTVALSSDGADFRLRLLDRPVSVQHFRIPNLGNKRFHFEPVKGNIVEGSASVLPLEQVPVP